LLTNERKFNNVYIMYEKGEKREKGEMGTLSYLEGGEYIKNK
jgi:hypothetical protein